MLLVPCARPSSVWTQRTPLGGQDYILTFRWLQRMGHWTMDLADQDEDPIASGLVIVAQAPLLGLANVIDDRAPEGDLMCLDLGETGRDPGFGELGTDAFPLVYLTLDDLA